ncbi:MAG: ATP-dependent DNA helicase RecG [Candidatus Omnitrophica bacterium]|nr:ATP-dependent DNA helicase RecG [Candidatus Omnitrophota bacterium]MDD5546676.1 ATP-dependent DNA helicase RecG [Candidatus Omnitrophota bacterium]
MITQAGQNINTKNQPLNEIPVRYVKGVGPARAEILARLDIATVEDLLYHFPRRYEDRSHFNSINKVKVGDYATIKGEVLTVGLRRGKPRFGRGKVLALFKMAVGDDTGVIYAVWFNQPYMQKMFRSGDKVVLYGKVERYKDIQITNPEFEIIKDDGEPRSSMEERDTELIHTGRIVPIYPLTEGISQRGMRSVIKNLLDRYLDGAEEFLPAGLRARNNLPELKEALFNIHFPRSEGLRKTAYERIVFDEFFALQAALAQRKARIKGSDDGVAHKVGGELLESFKEVIPFKLTGAQAKAIADIEKDMASTKPMNRLLEGDVGSGKTIVAAYALVLTVSNGYQGVLMAPTEILAQQHFMNLNKLLSPLGINIVILTNSVVDEARDEAKRLIEEGRANIVIGTHALIQEGVKFKDLGLAAIDEQHKFGVDQRVQLKQKGFNPDMLFMTATPIPRTLAMTLYGDLDLSILDEMPKGRIPPKAYWVGEQRREGIYKFIAQEVAAGSQAFIVYPLIEKGKKEDLKAAADMYEKFKKEVFPQFKVGLVHGRLDSEEKERVMADFKSGKAQILVSTTVIEVGIDNPNVSVMLVENPERFGLSQLHQLRGRIGRGNQRSYCILLSDTESEEAKKRLKALIGTTSGFNIAEEDLQLRGPGQFFGTRQHGLPELRYANLVANVKQLEAARKEAFDLVRGDPELKAPGHRKIREIIRRKFSGKTELKA